MPIYEFYCPDCHAIFSFLSRGAGSRKRPSCPRCDRPRLEKRASSFAISSGRPEPSADDGLPDLDEAGMERAMQELAHKADGIDENDPRAMARLMRDFYRSTGMPLGDGIEEAMSRMEAGEDPEQIEAEMGDLLDDDEALLGGEQRPGLKALRRRFRPPEIDDTLYEL
jgi:putative FmdB family regulatory protein